MADNHYILIQGTDNQQSLEIQSIISSYEQIFKQQTQALTEEKSQLANQSKATFLSLMSHELRTPLNAIHGFAQIQQFKLADQPELLSGNQRILNAGHHLLSSIVEMLDFVELKEQNLELQNVPCDLNQCLVTAIDETADLQQTHNIIISCPATDVKVRADERLLIKVIKHLLCNAIKFNQANGTVDIRIKLINHGHIEIAFKDSGVGISDSDQRHLF
jgi:signal transduction histidine kinase